MVDTALAQLLGVGWIWIAFHCAGMCGPIVGGVVGGRVSSTPQAIVHLLAYQCGRMTTLGLLGGVAGAVGHELVDERTGGVLALVVAAVLLASLSPRPALVGIGAGRGARRGRGRIAAVGDRLGAGVASLAAVVDTRLGRSPYLTGVVLGLLPCMIVAWGLSLAAATADAWRGARLMVVLVAMTTAPLVISVVLVAAGGRAGVVARLGARWPWLRALPVVTSALWLVMVGLAALGVVEHRHVVVPVLGPRTVMLW
jgi:sulfite exporter TauE/SafE